MSQPAARHRSAPLVGAAVTPTPGGRIRGLDGIRALAVLGVIAAHLHLAHLHGGGIGVDMFFALSGYLITSLLLGERNRTGTVSVVKFWGRRALRLFPALALLLLVVDVYGAVGHHVLQPQWDQGLTMTPWIALYVSNWFIVDQQLLGVFGPLWSLSVEEQFYIVWPLLVVAASRLAPGRFADPARVVAATAVAGIVGCFVLRAVTFDPDDILRTFGSDYHVDMMLYGAVLAVALGSSWVRGIRIACRILLVPALAVLGWLVLYLPEFNKPGEDAANRAYYVYGLPVTALATVVLIGFCVTGQDHWFTRVLNWRPLAWTGMVSYGIYLWHYPIIYALTEFDLGENRRTAATIVLTFAFAATSWYALERPLARRLKHYVAVH